MWTNGSGRTGRAHRTVVAFGSVGSASALRATRTRGTTWAHIAGLANHALIAAFTLLADTAALTHRAFRPLGSWHTDDATDSARSDAPLHAVLAARAHLAGSTSITFRALRAFGSTGTGWATFSLHALRAQVALHTGGTGLSKSALLAGQAARPTIAFVSTRAHHADLAGLAERAWVTFLALGPGPTRIAGQAVVSGDAGGAAASARTLQAGGTTRALGAIGAGGALRAGAAGGANSALLTLFAFRAGRTRDSADAQGTDRARRARGTGVAGRPNFAGSTDIALTTAGARGSGRAALALHAGGADLALIAFQSRQADIAG